MSYKFMRTMVFFDLPTETAAERREYRRFRKFLINEGFIMVQKSVYSKLLINNNSTLWLKTRIELNKPKDGLVQLLTITEKQYAKMEYITGESDNNVLDDTERLIII